MNCLENRELSWLRFNERVLELEPISAEYRLQLQKLCEVEDKFLEGLSEDKRKEYHNLELEKGSLLCLDNDRLIELTCKICKELYN